MDAQETYLAPAAFGRLRRRDQLRHRLQVIGVLLLFRGEGRAARARGARGWGVGGPGAGRGRGAARRARRCRGPSRGAKLAPDAPRRGRAAASVQCARAAASVCPRFPLPPPPALGSDSAASGPQSPSLSEQLPCPRSLAAARSEAGSEEQRRPRTGARVPAQYAPESEPGAQRASRAVTAAAPGGCRPRPPAAQALPLFSPPTCSIPHALQGNQTGLQQLRRREPRPQSDWVPESSPRDAAPCPGCPGWSVLDGEQGSKSPWVWPIPPGLQSYPGPSPRLSKAASGLTRLLG